MSACAYVICCVNILHDIQLHFSYFLLVPVAPPVIEMQAPKRVILVQGESLTLTCNTTNVNGEIMLQWVTPPGSVRHFCLFFAVFCAVGGRCNKKIQHINYWLLSLMILMDFHQFRQMIWLKVMKCQPLVISCPQDSDPPPAFLSLNLLSKNKQKKKFVYNSTFMCIWEMLWLLMVTAYQLHWLFKAGHNYTVRTEELLRSPIGDIMCLFFLKCTSIFFFRLHVF